MRRAKKKHPSVKIEISQAVVKKLSLREKTSAEITMKEMLVQCALGNPDAIIYVGNVVERIINDPHLGVILEALTAGRIDIELRSNRGGEISADRILGRCEMGATLWHDLENYVLEKDKMRKPVKEAPTEETGTASEPGAEQQSESVLA